MAEVTLYHLRINPITGNAYMADQGSSPAMPQYVLATDYEALRAEMVSIERENREGWKQAAHWRSNAERAATELEALRKRCEAAEFELDCLRAQYEERTAYTIVHRGAALCCSSAMRDAYSDEHHRAERLAKALNIAHRHIDMAALRISHAKDAEAIAAAQEPSHG